MYSVPHLCGGLNEIGNCLLQAVDFGLKADELLELYNNGFMRMALAHLGEIGGDEITTLPARDAGREVVQGRLKSREKNEHQKSKT